RACEHVLRFRAARDLAQRALVVVPSLLVREGTIMHAGLWHELRQSKQGRHRAPVSSQQRRSGRRVGSTRTLVAARLRQSETVWLHWQRLSGQPEPPGDLERAL